MKPEKAEASKEDKGCGSVKQKPVALAKDCGL